MAADISNFYRNYDLNDSTYENMSAVVAPDPSTLWEVQAGRSFIEWNTARDGTGASYAIGDYLFGVTLYAIWTPIIKYSTNNVELTSIANAIREKGGTSAQLVYPTGFVSAI